VSESESYEIRLREPLKYILVRAAALVSVFLLLALYLYLIQISYEKSLERSFSRALYFAATIFGAGLIWDVSKHIAQLPIGNLVAFLKNVICSIFFMFSHYVYMGITYLLTSTWAGIPTVVTPITAILGVAFYFASLNRLTAAVESTSL